MIPLLLAALPAVMGALNKGGSGGGAAPAGGGGGLPGIPGLPGLAGTATSGDATSGIGPVAVSYGPAVGNGGGSATATQTQPAPAAPQSSLPYVVPVASGGMESQTLIIAGGFGLLAIILLLRK